jgi:hypothetical protein
MCKKRFLNFRLILSTVALILMYCPQSPWQAVQPSGWNRQTERMIQRISRLVTNGGLADLTVR